MARLGAPPEYDPPTYRAHLRASKKRRERSARLRRRSYLFAPLALLGLGIQVSVILEPLPYHLWPLLLLGLVLEAPFFATWGTWL